MSQIRWVPMFAASFVAAWAALALSPAPADADDSGLTIAPAVLEKSAGTDAGIPVEQVHWRNYGWGGGYGYYAGGYPRGYGGGAAYYGGYYRPRYYGGYYGYPGYGYYGGYPSYGFSVGYGYPSFGYSSYGYPSYGYGFGGYRGFGYRCGW